MKEFSSAQVHDSHHQAHEIHISIASEGHRVLQDRIGSVIGVDIHQKLCGRNIDLQITSLLRRWSGVIDQKLVDAVIVQIHLIRTDDTGTGEKTSTDQTGTAL